jgi:ribosomal protein S18 acetylase RimI-like enzyme
MPHPAATDPTWRLRAIHEAMPFEEFERRVPYRAGWKREYYDGEAHVRPGWMCVIYELPLQPPPSATGAGARAVTEADREPLRDLFADAFRVAPEYADYPDDKYPGNADRYLAEFFGDKRGRWSRASRLVEEDGRAVAAATVKLGARRPILDCVMVRPSHFRRGLATRVTQAASAALAADGYDHVRSAAMLANLESQAWHRAFGFAELPSQMVAESRWRNASCELGRLREVGELSPDEEERRTAEIARLFAEVERLDQLRDDRFSRLFPTLDD